VPQTQTAENGRPATSGLCHTSLGVTGRGPVAQKSRILGLKYP
jgi:hypothetical protein